MNKRITISFAVLFAFLSANVFSQGFNSIHTPDGVNIIAVGNLGKIYRSTNSGSTWSSYTSSSDNLRSVYSFGNDVWITGSTGNVYKTSKLNSAISPYNVGSSIVLNSVYFVNSNIGYACGNGGNLYKSIDGGLTWTASASGISAVDLNSVSFLDDNKGITVGKNGAVFTTVNGGSSWNPEPVLTTRNLLDVKYYADGIVAVGEYGVILTKDNSSAWTSVLTRTDSDIRGVTGSGLNNSRVCGGGGFIRNNLNSRSNFFNFEVNPMMANLTDIFYYDANNGFAVSSLNYAIIRTTNAGQSWELPSGSSVTYSWVLCMHPKDRNSAFVVYGNKVYVSRDRSETWTQISTITSGSRAHSFYVSPVDTNIWLAAMESSPDNVSRTTNYGVTWTSVIAYDFSTYGQPLEMDQNDPSVFYFAPSNSGGTGVYRSTNNGANFTLTAPYNNSAINQPCDLIVMWDSSNVLYMGDDGADIFKSTNYGANWFQVKPGSSSEVPSMCNSVFDKSICYATTWSSSQVYKTNDFGTTWNITSNNSGSGWGSDVCREDPTIVLTGNYGSQAYLTTNAGTSFFNVNSGLSGAGAGLMGPDSGWLLNMQTGSLYKMNINYSIITNVNESTVSGIVPSSFELSQNYPNPFNPTTNIKFALPVSGNVSLKVYDRLGKEVNVLTDGFKAAGTYEINFDASSLTSGVYFYKLVSNNIAMTKKMLLVK